MEMETVKMTKVLQQMCRPPETKCYNAVGGRGMGYWDQHIKPRTEQEKNTEYTTISTSQDGESLCWYDFGDWTHPYYHKSEGQSALEIGIAPVVDTWNKHVPPPMNKFGRSKPLVAKLPRYPPQGPNHIAMSEHNRAQSRVRYSRYTMPDFLTHSLHSVQNPQERHKPIPCLRDQYILSSDIRQNLCKDKDFLKQREAYEKVAKKLVPHFPQPTVAPPKPYYGNVPCSLGVSYNHSAFQPKKWMEKDHQSVNIPGTDIHPERVSGMYGTQGGMTYDTFTTGNADMYPSERIFSAQTLNPQQATYPTKSHTAGESTQSMIGYTDLTPSSSHQKSVTWADDRGENIESHRIIGCNSPGQYMNLNSNSNNNFDERNKYAVTERKPCDIEGPGPRHQGCNNKQAMKRGKDFHYLDTNSEYFRPDIRTDYAKNEDVIEYRMPDYQDGYLAQRNPSANDNEQNCSACQLPPIDESNAEKNLRLSAAAKPPRYVAECGDFGEEDYYKHCRKEAEKYLVAEPSIYTQKLAAKQNPHPTSRHEIESERLAKMKVLLTTDQLNYPFMERGVIGYTGHHPRQALDLPPLKEERNDGMYQTTYRTIFCRNPFPSHEYVRSRTRAGHRAPFSDQMTLTEPYNPYRKCKGLQCLDQAQLRYQPSKKSDNDNTNM